MSAPRQPMLPPRGRQGALAVDPFLVTFLTIIDRLETTVDEETEALRRNQPARIGEIGQLKRQGMLELGRVMQRLSADRHGGPIRERLDRFAVKLEENRRMLDVHLRAVRGIAETIASSLRDVDSDGTYSRATAR